MVKQLISIALIGGVGALSACFGDGPMPTAPDGAIVVLSSVPGQSCSSGTYIGPVAIGSDHGYVSFLPYQPVGNNCGNNGGAGPITAAQQVFSFGLGGEALAMIGSAGESNNGAHVQIAATGSGAAWAYNDPTAGSSGSQVLVQPGGTTYGTNMGTELPLGLAAVGSDLYVATASNASTSGGQDLENPVFPNGGAGTVNGARGTIWKVGGGQVTTWNPGCGGLDRCVVAGGSALVYVERPIDSGTQWQITRYDLGSASPAPQLVTSQTTGADFPFGLDADDHLVAWSATQSCVFNMSGGNQHCEVSECSVSVFDTTMPQAVPKTLLATTQFGCLDAKLADGYVYFSIVGIYSSDNSMFGRGIGRVNIADRTLETLDLGIRGPQSGPRRIFPVGDQLFLVDPFVMARIPKSALDGKHDFTP